MTALPVQANLEQLSGSLDYGVCDDCNSVTSPAVYFVELLQFLHNNALDSAHPHPGQSEISPTPLKKLCRRCPDLGHLELSCAYTNSVLSYIDLANEVMESFIVHINNYTSDTHIPKQTNITVFNEDATTEAISTDPGSLLARAQNTDDKTYSALKDAVYPALNLSYDSALDEIRSLLEPLGTSQANICQLFQGYSAPSMRTTTSTASDTSDATRPTLLAFLSIQNLYLSQEATASIRCFARGIAREHRAVTKMDSTTGQ